jgi:cell wall assembly regulator SMI1
MDAIDKYIELLSYPAVRSFNRSLHHIDEDEPEQSDRPKTLEEHVMAAEMELGVALPPSYRRLVTTTDPTVKEYGLYWVWVEGLDTYGGDIVSSFKGSNSPLPPFLIAVLGTDGGDEYCFDTRHPDERGEYPIVHFDHEQHNEESTEFEKVANDLGEFLLGSRGGETTS